MEDRADRALLIEGARSLFSHGNRMAGGGRARVGRMSLRSHNPDGVVCLIEARPGLKSHVMPRAACGGATPDAVSGSTRTNASLRLRAEVVRTMGM
jgi:hypothetical protein